MSLRQGLLSQERHHGKYRPPRHRNRGVGAILPDAPMLKPSGKRQERPLQHHGSSSRPMGSELYYDPDHSAPDKTYSKIGGWVREYPWDPMKWRLPFRLASAMRWMARSNGRSPAPARRWKTTVIRKRPLNPDRTAVILGNAMAGEKHYLTALRIFFPEYASELEKRQFCRSSRSGPRRHRAAMHKRMASAFPKSRKTVCPANWRIASPGALRTSTTSTVRISCAMPRVPQRWPR